MKHLPLLLASLALYSCDSKPDSKSPCDSCANCEVTEVIAPRMASLIEPLVDEGKLSPTSEESIPYKKALGLFNIHITPYQLPKELPKDHHLCLFLRTSGDEITRLSSAPCSDLEGNAYLASKWNADGSLEIHVITSNGSFGYTKKATPSSSDRQESYTTNLSQLGEFAHKYTLHHSNEEKEQIEIAIELAPELQYTPPYPASLSK